MRPGRSRAGSHLAAASQRPKGPAQARKRAATALEPSPEPRLAWVHLLAAVVGSLAGAVLYGLVTGLGDLPGP
ncbi:MAG: hypothetical protein VKS61_00300 [Candidatus Sericytochromatia bacterium]|nr:hypothetical protein [Candidatus Sericytochromatia bacterium]